MYLVSVTFKESAFENNPVLKICEIYTKCAKTAVHEISTTDEITLDVEPYGYLIQIISKKTGYFERYTQLI